MNTKRKNQWTGLLFILPSLAGVMIFVMVPFLDVIRRSFTEAVSGRFLGINNYKSVFQTSAFLHAAGNTLKFVGICIPILICLSLLAAVFLQKQSKTGAFLKSAFLLPMAIPVASVVLLWRLLFDNHGILNGLLTQVNLNTADWMNSGTAFWVLVFSYVWKNLGYDVVLWVAGLSGISESIYEAARVDGAGEWKCFLKITLPNLLPSLFTIAVLSFLNSFKVFREAYLVAGNYPDPSMYLLQHLFNNWFLNLELDKMAAAAVINAFVIFLLVMLLMKAWGGEEEG